MKAITRLLATGMLCALSATAHAAVTYNIQGGKLTGASGVLVEGKKYDVSFVDGTCTTVYGKCDAINFAFNSKTGATLAAQALLDQVFVDGTAGQFDSDSTLTAGCNDESGCEVLIAYAAGFGDDTPLLTFQSVAAINRDANDPTQDQVTDAPPTFDAFSNTSTNRAQTFARFTLASAVPEPATWALMLAGFGLVGYVTRRRSRVGVATYGS